MPVFWCPRCFSDAVADGVVLVCMMEDLAGSCSLVVDILAILLPGQLEDDCQSFYAVLNGQSFLCVDNGACPAMELFGLALDSTVQELGSTLWTQLDWV
ncbi:unnamed protein product [Cuscuta campestris]|uniref:Uncharacterized protein n=1 Tax=Cuscuta campestris TaxID=132261 RepID=A0A484KMC9_9ASTE|nr:unnamed protein product [Cuscuta campestris]